MYVLDSNVFIDAKNRHYGFDFMPGFWDWIVAQHAAGVLCSIDDVKKELEAIQDDLTTWAKNNSAIFLPIDASVQSSMQQLAAWATGHSGYSGAAASGFLGVADYPLVAFAHTYSHTVVTHERSAPNSQKKIQIPDACTAFGVPCIDPFTMLRTEKARFVRAT
jgi:hypothetical protein